MGWYDLAWAVVLLPAAAVALAYLPESPRRAASLCSVASAGALAVSLVVLAYRLRHLGDPVAATQITFWTFGPAGAGQFPDLHPELGVLVDGLSAVVMPLVAALMLAAQVEAGFSLRGDPGLRRHAALLSALTASLLAVVAAPNLFDLLIAWGVGGVVLLLLSAHRFDDSGLLTALRRTALLGVVGDLTLALAVVFGFVKFGTDLQSQPLPANAEVNDPFSFVLLPGEWHRAHLGLVNGVGARTLVVLAVLFVVAAAVRAGISPLHGRLVALSRGPVSAAMPALAAAAACGPYLLARLYPLLLEAPHVLSAVAVVGGAGAVAASVIAAGTADARRLLALLAAAQGGLMFVALGSGAPGAAMLLLVAGGLALGAAYLATGAIAGQLGTWEVGLLGGARARMPVTWAGLTLACASLGGLVPLGGFWARTSVLAGALRGDLPNGGHPAGWVRGLVVALTLLALAAGAAAALRLPLATAAAAVRRRGLQPDRLREAPPAARVTVLGLAVPGALMGFLALEGVRGSFFTVVPVAGRPPAGFDVAAVLVGGAVMAAGCLAALLRGSLPGVVTAVRLGESRSAVAATVVEGRAEGLAASVPAIDAVLLRPLLDAGGEAIGAGATWLDRARTRAAETPVLATAVGVVVVAAGVTLAATGHLPGVGGAR